MGYYYVYSIFIFPLQIATDCSIKVYLRLSILTWKMLLSSRLGRNVI